MPKVTIVGSGQVGATATYYIAERGLADVVMTDVVEGMPQAKAIDAMHSAPLAHDHVEVLGTNDLADIAGSEVVVITAGLPRKPGMSREDLLNTNARIVATVAEQIALHAPDAVVIVVTNPLDIMTYVAWKVTGFGVRKVMGMAGVLDSTRFRYFIAEELGVAPEDVQALVLGGHGDEMVPVPEHSVVSGIPVTELIAPDRLEQIVARTRKGGGEIVQLLKTGSAFYAPAASIAEMVESVVRGRRRILPVAAYLRGEYGIRGHFIGVPAVVGRSGVERVVELDLDERRRAELRRSVDLVEETLSKLEIAL